MTKLERVFAPRESVCTTGESSHHGREFAPRERVCTTGESLHNGREFAQRERVCTSTWTNMVTDSNVGPRQKGKNRRNSWPLPLARNCIMLCYMLYVMMHVTYFYIWNMLWYMYHVAQAAAVHAFMRYGACGRPGRRGCSRSLNRVAPPGGDGGLTLCRREADHGSWGCLGGS